MQRFIKLSSSNGFDDGATARADACRGQRIDEENFGLRGIKVPEFAVFPRRRAFKRPERLAFPLFVKSLTEEESAGVSPASIVDDDEKLVERVAFIHRTTRSSTIAG